MHAHTQGPWIVAPSSNKGNGSDWRDIHSIGGEFSPSYVGEALEQDAYLIAAAPDLLSLVRAWLMTDPHGPHSDKCREAIAKATNANPRR